MGGVAILTAPDQQTTQIATLGYIPEGVAGTRATLAQMASWVRLYRVEPQIRAFAEQIIANVPSKDEYAEINAIFEWVRDNVRYTQDVRDVEMLKSPDALISERFGDCDDMSTLVSTLLETVGYTTRLVAVGYTQPGVYEHVYAEVILNGAWVSLETTEPVSLGFFQPNERARMEVPV